MGVSLLVPYNNLVAGGTLRAMSEASDSLSVENLRDSQVRRPWRTGSVSLPGLTGYNWVSWQASAIADSAPFRVLGIINHDIDSATGSISDPTPVGSWRVRGVFDTLSGRIIATRTPEGLVGMTNLTGTVADLQDPEVTPDTTWLTAVSDTANTQVRTTFGDVLGSSTPGLSTSASEQTVSVWVRKSAPGANPTFTLDLFQSGVFHSTLINAATVSSETGELHTVNFTSPTSGADTLLSFRLTGNASAAATVEFGWLVWFVEFNMSSNPSAFFDSGPGDFNQLNGLLESWYRDPYGFIMSRHYDVGATKDDLWSLWIDFFLGGTVGYVASNGYFSVGQLVAGDAIELGIKTISVDWRDNSQRSKSRGGQTHVSLRGKYRVMTCEVPNIDNQGYVDFENRVSRYAGLSRPVFLVLDTTIATYNQQNNLIYGLINDVKANKKENDIWSITFTIEELV